MDKEAGKQVWVVPTLEKLEMALTRGIDACGATPDARKSPNATERGQCGQGS